MKHLFSAWSTVAGRLRGAQHRIYLFDFDGTLTAISENPDRVRLPVPVREVLALLAKRSSDAAGIISGRDLRSLKKIIHMNRLVLSGNHGLEIEGRGIRFVHPVAKKRRKLLSQTYRSLIPLFNTIDGALLENKRYSLTLHWRRIRRKKALEEFKRKRKKFVDIIGEGPDFTIKSGKKIVEIRPNVKWDKGAAIRLIKRNLFPHSVVLYAGDDKNDKDAFRSLGKKDVGVQIGRTSGSFAPYYLTDHREVELFLRRLIKL
jgi:trehalose-phosphatase